MHVCKSFDFIKFEIIEKSIPVQWNIQVGTKIPLTVTVRLFLNACSAQLRFTFAWTSCTTLCFATQLCWKRWEKSKGARGTSHHSFSDSFKFRLTFNCSFVLPTLAPDVLTSAGGSNSWKLLAGTWGHPKLFCNIFHKLNNDDEH